MSRFLIIVSILYIILAVYGFQGFKTLFKNQWAQIAYGVFFLGALGYFFSKFLEYVPGKALQPGAAIAGGVFFSFFMLALLLGFFLLLEDIVRLFAFGYNKINGIADGDTKYLPSRRKFVSIIGLGLAALPFGALLYGMYKGKYNYKVLKYELAFDDLPDAFDGYQITQISDVHSGSFDNREKVSYGIDLINKQKSDVILFTGDMVNNKTEEMKPWADLFSKLSAKDGVYSVLGNHDYGDYVGWDSDDAKSKNLQDLKDLQAEMGFDLLLDSHRYIERNGDKIALLGKI